MNGMNKSEIALGVIGLLFVGFICGIGFAGGFNFTQDVCDGTTYRECIPHQTGTDLVYLITSTNSYIDCALAVDTNNIVGWKCPGYFQPEHYHGFNLIVDGNWRYD